MILPFQVTSDTLRHLPGARGGARCTWSASEIAWPIFILKGEDVDHVAVVALPPPFFFFFFF